MKSCPFCFKRIGNTRSVCPYCDCDLRSIEAAFAREELRPAPGPTKEVFPPTAEPTPKTPKPHKSAAERGREERARATRVCNNVKSELTEQRKLLVRLRGESQSVGLTQNYSEALKVIDLLLSRLRDADTVPLKVTLYDGQSAGSLARDALETMQLAIFRRTAAGELFIFRNCLYDVTSNRACTDDQIRKLVVAANSFYENALNDLEDQCIGEKPRDRISEGIRHEVWRRDEGKCCRCGSRDRLEFDHIVPISKGGSNTARNIELLCEKCNRGKGNRV